MYKKSKIYFFIDTSSFRQCHFNTNSRAFKNLCRLCHDKKMHQITTQITLNELESNIKEYTGIIYERMVKVSKDIGHTNIYKKYKLDEINANLIEKELWKSLIDFFQLSRTDILTIPENTVSDVFDKYFKKLPPFGKNKKKSEFPDAFVVAALQRNAKVNKRKIYIISGDSDFSGLENDYDGLKCLNSIDEILNICYREIIDKEYSLDLEEVDNWIEVNEATILHEIENKIEGISFYLSGFNGEVESFTCEKVIINNKNIIDMNDDTAMVSLDLTCIVTFDIIFDDPEMTYYDSEEQETHCFERREKSITKEFNAECTLKLSYDEGCETFDLDDLELEGIDDTINLDS